MIHKSKTGGVDEKEKILRVHFREHRSIKGVRRGLDISGAMIQMVLRSGATAFAYDRRETAASEGRRMACLRVNDNELCDQRPQPRHLLASALTCRAEALETVTTTLRPKPPSDYPKQRLPNTSACGKPPDSLIGKL